MTFEQWDVIVVPFPFSEKPGGKRRPALVLSKGVFNRSGHTVLAMITSARHARWPGDAPLAALQPAGIKTPCIVRLKLFTLDNRLTLYKIGRLSAADRETVTTNLRSFLL